MTLNRESVRVREEVARALKLSFQDSIAAIAGMSFGETGVSTPADTGWNRYAEAALNRLRELNLITSEGLELIKAEEKAE